MTRRLALRPPPPFPPTCPPPPPPPPHALRPPRPRRGSLLVERRVRLRLRGRGHRGRQRQRQQRHRREPLRGRRAPGLAGVHVPLLPGRHPDRRLQRDDH